MQKLERVQKHAQEKGWDLAQENIFRGDGYSGTTLKRPALDALRDKARLRELEVVVVLSAPIACSLISRPTSSQRSEMGYSLRLLALSAWGYTFGSASAARVPPCAHEEALYEGFRDFFVSPAHTNPQKVSRALMDPLADAVCCAAKWLKSS
jgi:Resolvase, N terminal domain